MVKDNVSELVLSDDHLLGLACAKYAQISSQIVPGGAHTLTLYFCHGQFFSSLVIMQLEAVISSQVVPGVAHTLTLYFCRRQLFSSLILMPLDAFFI